MAKRGHIRRRGKASWEVKVDLGRDPLSGKRRTRYATVRGTRKDAQVELTRILSEVDRGIYVEPSKLDLDGYLDHWLAAVKPQLGAKTHERYTELCKKTLKPQLGAINLSKLRPLHIQEAYAKLLATGRKAGKAGLSPQTVLHAHRVLKAALRAAVGWQMLATNPAAWVRPPSPPRREIRVLDENEVAALLRQAKDSTLYAPILVAVTTGLRRGELLALRWKDVDLDGGRLTVNQTLEQTRGGGLAFKPPKTKRSRRTIDLAALTVETLRAHRVAQLEDRMKLGLGKDAEALVFAQPDGAPISPESVTKSFRIIARNAGLAGVTFHGLRHTHLTELMRQGVNPKVVSERAGHASVAITLDVYGHVMPGMGAQAVKALDASLRAAIERG